MISTDFIRYRQILPPPPSPTPLTLWRIYARGPWRAKFKFEIQTITRFARLAAQALVSDEQNENEQFKNTSQGIQGKAWSFCRMPWQFVKRPVKPGHSVEWPGQLQTGQVILQTARAFCRMPAFLTTPVTYIQSKPILHCNIPSLYLYHLRWPIFIVTFDKLHISSVKKYMIAFFPREFLHAITWLMTPCQHTPFALYEGCMYKKHAGALGTHANHSYPH